MDLQTITGTSKSFGAVVNGGTISARPSILPQVVNGVFANTTKIVSDISATTGDFSIKVAKGAKLLIRGVDGAGREFLRHTITVSSDNELPLSVYLSSNPPAVPAQADAAFLAHCSVDPETGLPLWDGGPWPGSGGVVPTTDYMAADYVAADYVA